MLRGLLLSTALIISFIATPVSAAKSTQVDCSDNPLALGNALDSAASGDELEIHGTCIGTFTLERDVSIRSNKGATLDGNGSGTVLTVLANVQGITVTGGYSVADVAIGGIDNQGILSIADGAVVGNTAVGVSRAVAGIYSGPSAATTLTLQRTVVENNYLLNNPSEGVFDKEGGEDNVYRRNVLRDNFVGLKINNQSDSRGIQNERTQIYENLFICSDDSLRKNM